ncbi:MAG TPA: M36 family metallopeptidase, partial [Verrucomicrobiae bacterium]|nr:M36 family metallopeptidase [Verrucomicrobiae bacterium]
MALSAFAQEQPLLQALPNLDKRQRSEPPAERRAAATRLKAAVPDTAVEFDDVTGAPKHIISRKGPLDKRPRPQEAHGEVKAFLRENAALFGHGPEALDRARVKRYSTGRHNGVRTVVWEQQVGDIPVFDGVFIAHTTANGELASVSSQFVADPEQATQRGMPNWAAKKAKLPISQELAQAIAARNMGGESRALSAKLVWLPMSADAMRLAWEVYVKAQPSGDAYRLFVDAESGEILLRHARTFYLRDATYNIFTRSPAPMSPALPSPGTNQAPLVSRTMVTIAALSTNASPVGWIGDAEEETRGNNVDAHLDRNGDDQPDLPRPHGGPGRMFDFSADLTRGPTSYGEAATVNLFYWCNWMHDRLYGFGFDEGAG